jgi:two-component system response regulator AgrA
MRRWRLKKEIVVSNRFCTVNLDRDAILYVEKSLRKVVICTEEKSYWEYCVMENILDRIDDRMYRCHRSLAVNLDKVREITKDCLILQNGQRLCMCRSNLRNVRKAWEGRGGYVSHRRGGKEHG